MRGMVVGEGGRSSGVLLYHQIYEDVVNILELCFARIHFSLIGKVCLFIIAINCFSFTTGYNLEIV